MEKNLGREQHAELRLLGRRTGIHPQGFTEAAWILLKKPHIVNTRLTGSRILSCRDHLTGEPVGVSQMGTTNANDLEVLRRLIPKSPEKFSPVSERCVLAKKRLRIETNENSSEHLPPVVEAMTFEIRLEDDETVCIFGSRKFTEEFGGTLLRRFTQWMRNSTENSSPNQVQIDSLSLVDLELYSCTYARLKRKFGKKLVEIWPEKTDPKKFVYEDIAIASYLISLWDPERTGKKVTFIDVGCGNGLLVYILLQEGHKGFGVDVRRRGLWDMYPPDVGSNLLERPVSPETRHSEIEWWIGNHSDELTPWIPLLATMSSPTAKVFLLPCCPYGLFGKFQRGTPELSQYQSYLNFLRHDFLPDCGFRVEMDKLRIPSTKRVCFVGRERLDESHGSVVKRLRSRLEKEEGSFVPRPKEITVKNCTQISNSITEPLVNRIAKAVLASGSDEEAGYNRGGELPLSEAVKLVEPHELKVLKTQCGGLQTLLKNNYHIFKVIRGRISLRIPEEKSIEKEKTIIRKRECWFDVQHPQGCPVGPSVCRFQHSQA